MLVLSRLLSRTRASLSDRGSRTSSVLRHPISDTPSPRPLSPKGARGEKRLNFWASPPIGARQLHLELTEGWQPDDVMQAMAVKAIAEKSFDKASLRAAWMESQLTASRVGEIQA